MKKLPILILAILIAAAGCSTVKKKPMSPEDYMRLAEETAGKTFMQYDEDTTPAATDVILKSAAGAGTSRMTFPNLFSDISLFADGSVSSAEFQYLGDATGLIQAQLNGKQGTLSDEAGLYTALSDVSDFVQPSEMVGVNEPFGSGWNGDPGLAEKDDIHDYEINFDTDLDGSYDDETITPTRDSAKLKIHTSDPSVSALDVIAVDNDTYDPINHPGTDDYAAIKTSTGYKGFYTKEGVLLLSSIELPSYAHFSGADAAYDDNTTPHVLISAETKNTILTNAGAADDEDHVYTLHAYDFGMNFDFIVWDFGDASIEQVDLEPPSGGKIWLDGNEYDADEHIINNDSVEGDWIHCQSVETANGTYELYCKSEQGYWRGSGGNDSGNFYRITTIPIDHGADGLTPPAALADQFDTAKSNPVVRTRLFDGAATNEYVWFEWQVPSDFLGTTFKTRAVTYLDAATTGEDGVVFGASAVSIGDNDPLDSALGDAISDMTWTATAADKDRMITSWSSAITAANIAAGETVIIKFFRLQSDGGDIFESDLGVSHIQIKYESLY